MTEERKQQLSALFMYYFTIRNVEGYQGYPETPDQGSIKEWSEQFKEDQSAQQAVVAAFEDKEYEPLWKEVEQTAMDMMSAAEGEQPGAAADAETNVDTSQEIISAKKGAYLKKLRSYKKGGVKKCACGCDLVDVKEDGGKIVSKCSCGCSAHKETASKYSDKINKIRKVKVKK